VPLTATQQTIARRMAESRATIPSFTTTMEVDATAAVALQRDLRAHAADRAPSINDLVVKAVALALREFPRLNAAYESGKVHEFARVNVAVAVATDDALYVPAVLDADAKSVVEIAGETRALAERAREKALTVEELTAGTFTVSNLGMFGVLRFEAIVNPPQVAILAVGAATRRPAVAADGSIEARDAMELTLSADHRVVYGADAARFLRRVRELLERPGALLLG
jgi:pyruvate dehydrogenase E2 component (dihydrolipoamide acetyltransferase)